MAILWNIYFSPVIPFERACDGASTKENFNANRLVSLWLTIFYQRRGEFSSLKPYTENLLSQRDLEMILEPYSFRK